MFLTESQTTIVKKLFYLALFLTTLDILSIYVLRGLLGLNSDHPGFRIVNTLIYLTNPVVLWYLVGKFTKDSKAALYAMAMTIIISLGFTLANLLNDTSGGFDNMFIKTLTITLPFLAFGIAHHKSSKALLYLIPCFVFYGLNLGDLFFVFSRFENILRNVDFDGFFRIKIQSGAGSYWHIYPLKRVIRFSHLIIEFILMIKFYSVLNKKNWNDYLLRTVQRMRIDTFGFSIIFWVSRFIILSLFFGLSSRMEWFNNVKLSNSMLFVWFPSLAIALYVFLSFYRNFLTSYLISKNILPGWRYLLLNIPIINFITWLHLILAKENNEKPQLISNEIIEKQFDYREKNINIKVTIALAIIIITLLRVFNFRGSDEKTLILLANGIVSLLVMVAYFSNSKFYMPILIISLLLLFSLPILGAMEGLPLVIASITNVIIWYPLYHLNKMNFAEKDQVLTK